MLCIHLEEGQVWLRWTILRASPSYIVAPPLAPINQAFSIAVYPHCHILQM